MTVAGGGVAVTQAVHGSSGWSEAPVPEHDRGQLVLPGGTTANSDPLYVSLLNPTSTPVVVDLSLHDADRCGPPHQLPGDRAPVRPGAGRERGLGGAERVDREHRRGDPDGARRGDRGAGVRRAPPRGSPSCPGAAYPESRWTIPQSQDAAGGSSGIDVFNPGHGARVGDRAPATGLGPARPAHRDGRRGRHLGPGHRATRRGSPHGATYSADVEATGGPGGRRGPDGRAAQLGPGTPGGHGAGGGRPERRVADRHVGGAAARHQRDPGRRRRRARLAGHDQHLGRRRGLRGLRPHLVGRAVARGAAPCQPASRWTSSAQRCSPPASTPSSCAPAVRWRSARTSGPRAASAW